MADTTVPDEPNKRCRTCEQWKPLSEFHKNRNTRDGHESSCKECARERARRHYAEVAKDPERLAERRMRTAEWHRNNPEWVREKQRKRRQKDPEKFRRKSLESYRRLRQIDPSRDRERRRAWWQANPEKRRENYRRWAAANPEKKREKDSRRRARVRELSVEPVDFKALLVMYGLTCYLCGDDIPESDVHMDHVTPLSRGGSHSMDNLRPTHSMCNLRKGSKLPSELDWVVGA